MTAWHALSISYSHTQRKKFALNRSQGKMDMKKHLSNILRVAVLATVAAPLVYASDLDVSHSALAEPLYLSVCGIILVAFGALTDKKSY